ncbi:hypothetical protein D3C71_1249240 [compost metagenome]
MLIAAVIEHRIQHDLYAPLMSFVNEGTEQRVVSEIRINAEIVPGIVFMRAGGCEERCEINAPAAQIPDIIQLVDNALNIASEFDVVAVTLHASPWKRVLCRSASPPAEPVGKNLIPDRVLHPSRPLVQIFLKKIGVIVIIRVIGRRCPFLRKLDKIMASGKNLPVPVVQHKSVFNSFP